MISGGARPDASPLGLGEPTWELPAPARQALADSRGVCSYGPNDGLPELRRAVADFHGASADEVVITLGSQGALFCLLQGWIGPGDRVLIPDPGFAAYPALVSLAGGTSVLYRLSEENRFRLQASDLLPLLLEAHAPRAVILNHPANPTGAGVSAEDLARIAAVCHERSVLLIADEVYRDLYFGERPPSLRDVSPHGVVVSSVSKGWGAPGLRIGWAVGDTRWLDPLRLVHGYSTTCAPRPCQLAALALIEASDAILTAARRELEVRWQTLVEAMTTHLGARIEPPDGSFYHWMPLPASADGVQDPMQFCLRVRDEAGVVLVPGSVFGVQGRSHVRLSFAAAPEHIAEGVRRLAPLWKPA